MNLKSSDIKQLLDEIVEEEKEKHGLTFDFHYVGKLTFIKNMKKIYKRKLKLVEQNKKIKRLVMRAPGFQDKDYNIIVVYKKAKKLKIYDLTFLIYLLYHEIGHAIDTKRDSYDISKYDDLIYFLDFELLPWRDEYYEGGKYHDSMSFEIQADIYGLRKTREFFEKHPEILFDGEFLNRREKIVNEHYETYDLAQRIDEIINEGHYIYKEQDIRKKSPFSIFINNDGNFRHIDDILKDPDFHELDQRIINGFLKSENFKKSLLDSDISQESQEYLTNLYEKIKPKKLIIQKQEKYDEINNVIKQSKIALAMSLVAFIALIVEWILCINIKEIDPNSYNFGNLLNIGILSFLSYLDFFLVKNIINQVKHKYNLSYSVSEEEIDEFMNILEQKKLENNRKSL